MEEKKKRKKCATSSNHPIILNSRNPKEKIILDFLQAQYNSGGTIKEILYRYIVDNNLQVSTHHIMSNCIVDNSQIPMNNIVNSNSIANQYVSTNNEIVSECIVNSNKVSIDNIANNKSQPFKIEFDESDDEIAEVNNKKKINPNEAALKSLTNMWQ